MKDFEIKNGDLDPKLINDIEAKLQSIRLRLIIQRGSFIYDETLGSRLYLLLREKPSNWDKLGRIYVEEALSDEEDIEIIDVEIEVINKKQICIKVYFKWLDKNHSLEVVVDDEV